LIFSTQGEADFFIWQFTTGNNFVILTGIKKIRESGNENKIENDILERREILGG